jgi:uncharacterized protein (DUF433 family)
MALPDKLPPFLTRVDDEIRVVGARVSLVDLVHCYRQGFTAEMLGERFPSVDLAAIHHIIGFYMENRQAVDALVAERFAGAEEARNAHVPHEKMLKLRQRVQALHAARVKHAHAT